MKLKIVSDGYLGKTKVIDENNNVLEGVAEIKWEVDANTFVSKAILTIVNPDIDVYSQFNFNCKEFNLNSQTFDEKKEELYCHVTGSGSPTTLKVVSNDKLLSGITELSWEANAANYSILGQGSKYKLED